MKVISVIAYLYRKGFIRQHYLKHDKDVIEHLACEKMLSGVLTAILTESQHIL